MASATSVPDPAERAALLHGLLRERLSEARLLKIREFETQSAEDIRTHLVPKVRRALETTLTTVGEILQEFDDPGQDDLDSLFDGDFFAQVDEIMGSESDTAVADLAFVIRLELKAKLDALRQLDPSAAAWHALSICSSARRRILKACTALSRAVQEKAGINAGVDDDFVTEIKHTLAVRRAYTSFRKSIEACGTPSDDDELRKALRTGGIQIAIMIGRDIYPSLRILDRIELRRLQALILEWLRADTTDSRAGHRVFQDLNAFAGLLVQVNRRGELCEHDLATLREFARGLEVGQERVCDEWRDHLSHVKRVWGRNDALDELIEDGSCEPLHRWKEVITGVITDLEGTGAVGTPSPISQDVSEVIVLLNANDVGRA
jgi:hypothetical protein